LNIRQPTLLYSLYHSATVRIVRIVFFTVKYYNARTLLLDLTYVHTMLYTINSQTWIVEFYDCLEVY